MRINQIAEVGDLFPSLNTALLWAQSFFSTLYTIFLEALCNLEAVRSRPIRIRLLEKVLRTLCSKHDNRTG